MTHERNVFINCPFDQKYRPLLRALLFAVYDCGFRARSALEVEDSGEVRVQRDPPDHQRIATRDSRHFAASSPIA